MIVGGSASLLCWRKSSPSKTDQSLRKYEAVGAGVLEIEDGRVVLPRLKAQTEDPKVMDGRRVLFGHLGSVQLPSVLVEVDSHTRFSWSLLGRAPRSEQELVTVYAALLALGSDLTGASRNWGDGLGEGMIGRIAV
jgi:hypothetical protein